MVGALATAAAFTDFANLNLGGEGGIGSDNRFDIAVVLPNNTVEQADTDAGYNWEIEGAKALVPGGHLETTIPVFNNTSAVVADTQIAVELRGADGSVGDAPNIVDFLRFTASVDGTDIFTNVTWEQAQGSLGNLAARDAAPLASGAQYVPGASGSAKDIVLSIDYLDETETVNYNGGMTAIRLAITSSSAA